MIFISSDEVDRCVQECGMVETLKRHGRKRVVPGLTVADYVLIPEFYAHAHHKERGNLAYWDKLAGHHGKPA